MHPRLKFYVFYFFIYLDISFYAFKTGFLAISMENPCWAFFNFYLFSSNFRQKRNLCYLRINANSVPDLLV
jgi:hypothetical protein